MPAAVSAMVRDRLPDAWRAVADALGVPAGQRAYPRVILLGSRDLYRRRLVEGGTPLAAAERIVSGAAGSTDGDRRDFDTCGPVAVTRDPGDPHEMGIFRWRE